MAWITWITTIKLVDAFSWSEIPTITGFGHWLCLGSNPLGFGVQSRAISDTASPWFESQSSYKWMVEFKRVGCWKFDLFTLLTKLSKASWKYNSKHRYQCHSEKVDPKVHFTSQDRQNIMKVTYSAHTKTGIVHFSNGPKWLQLLCVYFDHFVHLTRGNFYAPHNLIT